FEAWIRSHFGPALASLGLPGRKEDDEQRDSRRAALLTIVGVTGNDADVQRMARELATQSLDGASVVAPTLAATVLNVGALNGDAVLYDRYMAQVQAVARNSEEYYRVFHALAWFSNPALIRRTLDFMLTPAARSQDVGLLVT